MWLGYIYVYYYTYILYNIRRVRVYIVILFCYIYVYIYVRDVHVSQVAMSLKALKCILQIPTHQIVTALAQAHESGSGDHLHIEEVEQPPHGAYDDSYDLSPYRTLT
jgi:hypothetical protein